MDSPILSPTGPRHRKTRLSCRRIDRLCCSLLCYFPLVFISGVSSWAVYSYSYSICWNNIAGAKGIFLAFLGLTLYFLLNWSYFTAVFTNPGSPLDNKHSYSSLPTTETSTNSSISVKSSGQARFCKKCQCYKPDRTHHCSSCKTCVLKMDHHCPWLANCLGMFNYKAFMLFLIYTSVFCLLCFVVSSAYVYEELLSSNSSSKYPVDDLTPVNWVLLAVLSGIIGLVLSGFTIWHLTLVGSGMTTIESLEKVRYTTPTLSRSGVPAPGAHHLYDNPENDPAFDYAAEREHEREQEFRRYNSYILEESTKKLPHPFDLGRARNFRCVFGPREEWWKWFIPRFSGVGDGWNWETSNEWRIAAEAVRVERERMGLDQGDDARSGWPGANRHPAVGRTWNGGNPNGLIRHAGEMKPSKAERILGKLPGTYSDGENVPLQRMNRAPDDISSDEEDDERIDLETGLAIGRKAKMEPRSAGSVGWATWGGGTSEERW